MAIKVNTQKFCSALSKIISIIDRKSTQPILGFSELTLHPPNRIELSATNLEVSASLMVEAENVENSLSCCVNAKNLFDILREMPNEEIYFELIEKETERFLNLESNNIHYSLLIYGNEEFPTLVFENDQNQVKVPSKDILEMINMTSHAISHDDTRPYLNGIFVQEIDNCIRCVSTDAHRLALYEMNYPATSLEILTNGIIIPKKGIQELKKLAESFPQDELSLSFDESFVYILAGDTYKLSIRLISREYPKYQSVIPERTVYSIRINRDALLDSIKRIKIMSNEKSNGVRLTFQENELILKANHPTLGDAREKITIDYTEKIMEIGFNAKFLIDVLSVMDTEDIYLEFNNGWNAVFIRSETIPSFLGIIMPLKF